MAISFVAGGNAGSGAGSTAPTVSASALPGDMLLAFVVNKYPPNGPTTPSGWTLVNQISGGSGSAGADVGTVYATMYYRICIAGDENATVTITVPSGNSGWSRILCFHSDGTTGFDAPVSATGAQNTAGSTWTVDTSSAVSLATNDVVVAFSAINTDAYTYSAEAITQPNNGTYSAGAFSERSDAGSVSGDDCGGLVGHSTIISGDNSIVRLVMTASGTATDNPAGATIIARLRETAATNVVKVGARRTLFIRRGTNPEEAARARITQMVEQMRKAREGG